MLVTVLRRKYPKFIYRNYSYKISGRNLQISFFFEIPPDIKFHSQITINNVTRTLLVARVSDNLVFHIGLIEMLSYWKTTCSPEIVIEAGCLDKAQINWWKNLIIKGMGQFFYENKIDWRVNDFLKISSCFPTPDVGDIYRRPTSVKLYRSAKSQMSRKSQKEHCQPGVGAKSLFFIASISCSIFSLSSAFSFSEPKNEAFLLSSK